MTKLVLVLVEPSRLSVLASLCPRRRIRSLLVCMSSREKVLSFNSKVVEPLNLPARMFGAESDDISRNIVFGWVLVNLS